MDMKDAKPEDISHSDTGSRGVFFLERDGRRVAELSYTMSAGAALVDHTYAVRWARQENVKIVPLCSYVRSVFARKAEYGDVRR